MKTREQRLEWLLRQILDSLPTRRDWLDPSIEGEARMELAQSKDPNISGMLKDGRLSIKPHTGTQAPVPFGQKKFPDIS
jgi:hypothetical protein